MREIKFRSWDARNKQMDIPDAIANSIDGEKYQIMQYIGLKDKNGKEAYEADLCRDPPAGRIWEVVWGNEDACFELYNADEFPTEGYMWIGCIRRFEVIGNVYENPEKRGK